MLYDLGSLDITEPKSLVDHYLDIIESLSTHDEIAADPDIDELIEESLKYIDSDIPGSASHPDDETLLAIMKHLRRVMDRLLMDRQPLLPPPALTGPSRTGSLYHPDRSHSQQESPAILSMLSETSRSTP